MSDAEQFRWLETYFVYFSAENRPALDKVAAVVSGLKGHFRLERGDADDDGAIESLAIRSPDDHTAVEITYLEGEDVQEQALEVVQEMRGNDGCDPKKIAQLIQYDARFDLMHLELQADDDDADDLDELLDPSTLLMVMESLIELTGGVGVDPQSGTLM